MGTYALLLLILLFWVDPYIFFGFTLVSLYVLLFDALFVFLVFPLNGPLFLKIIFIIGSHTIGLTWEYFLSFIDANLSYHYGSGFHGLYMVLNPFLELLWVVSVWSLGLSFLASMKKRGELS